MALNRPEWQLDAECRDIPFARMLPLFYPQSSSKESQSSALAICKRCKVRRECLAYAMDTAQDYGIWGGKTTQQRLRMAGRNRISRVAFEMPRYHGDGFASHQHYLNGCRCRACITAEGQWKHDHQWSRTPVPKDDSPEGKARARAAEAVFANESPRGTQGDG